MNTLGIDWGEAKVGLSLSQGNFAEPYEVIRYKDIKILREKLREIVKKEKIDRLVVGISEGKMGEEAKEFSLDLSKNLEIPVETFDETLTTQEAQRLAIEAKVKRKKRKGFEDAFAATLLLQSYLDSF